MNITLSTCLNLATNLVHQVFESHRDGCADANCTGTLKRVFRSDKSHKGSISVIYRNISGPRICVSFRKSCSLCSSIYYFGYFENANGDTVREKREHCGNVYQSTECTFFDVQMFDEYRAWRCDNGISTEAFCEIYNLRHSKSFDTLHESLGDRCVGRRKSSDVRLEKNRFDEAWCMFELQTLVNDDLNSNFVISKQLKQSATLKKQTKVLISRKAKESEPYQPNDNKSMVYICMFLDT